MFTLDINSFIACLRLVRRMCRDQTELCAILKTPMSCTKGGHILPNGRKKHFFLFFLLLQCQSILKFCNKLDFATEAPLRYRTLALTFAQLQQNIDSCNHTE